MPQQPDTLPHMSDAQQPTYVMVKAPSNGMATTALIMGITAIAIGIWVIIPVIGLAIPFLSFIPAILAIIFGHIGVNKAKTLTIGKSQALTGLWLGYGTIGLSIIVTIFWIIAMAVTG